MKSTGSTSSISIVAGDFNNDYRQDIAVVVNNDTNNVDILLGYDEGFSEETTIFNDYNPYLRTVGDFNNNSRPDIVVVNQDENNVGILLGYGNGTFADQMTYRTGSQPSSLAIGDFNNDAQLDIVVINQGDDNAGVFLGYGNGSFAIQMTYSTYDWPGYLRVGDFNNDAKLDIAVVHIFSDTAGILLGYGNGSFANEMTFQLSQSAPVSIDVGDFNSDNHLDVVISCIYKTDRGTNVFLGYGSGSFANPILCYTCIGASSVTVGDFNNDTRLDLVVANSVFNYTSILLGHGNGSFANPITYSTGYYPRHVAIGDFNNDTQLYLVIFTINNILNVLLHINSVAFEKELSFAFNGGSDLSCVVVGDFNNDDRLDIIAANYGTNNVAVVLGYGDGTFTSQVMLGTGLNSHPYSIAIGNFTEDVHLDIVVINIDDGNVGVLLGYGNGSFINQTTYPTGSLPPVHSCW